MLILTAQLRKHMAEKLGVPADANDDAIRKAVADSIMSGKLTAAEVLELTKSATEAKSQVAEMIAESQKPILEAMKSLTELLAAKGSDGAAAATGAPASTKAHGSPTQATLPAAGNVDPNAPTGAKAYAAAGMNAGATVAGQGNGSAADETAIRVKSVLEQFDDTKTLATYDKSENPYLVKNFSGRAVGQFVEGPGAAGAIDMPTPRSKAIAGAWFKLLVNKSCKSEGRGVPANFRLTELDRKLCEAAAHTCRFVGPVGYKGGDRDSTDADHWFDGEKATDELWRKAILDDSTSGGLEAVPIEFDAAVILTPLLNGQIFPLVSVTNVTRRRIEATTVSNPTMTWGTAEGTEIPLFDTASFIGAFDNSIYPLTGAMELGRDFLADSPLDIGGIVVDRYGLRFRKVMDTVIVSGNGTDRPEGVFTKSGLSTVASANTTVGPPTVGDYEGLLFGIPLEYRQEAGARAVFIANETSYKRARGIAVGTSDQRRVFGMEEEDFRVLGKSYRIEDGLGNGSIGHFCMNRYRLYRRQGLEVRIVTDDSDLARRNKQLVVVRARFGGAFELAAAGIKFVSAQA